VDKAPDAFRTISEVAEDLNVPQHVLRFWESRFSQIKPMKRAGGRRYYRPDDVDLLRGIHHLLYGQGYTIRGVQKILRDQGQKYVQSIWQGGALPPDTEHDGSEADAFDPEGEEETASPHARPAMVSGVRPILDSRSGHMSREDVRKLQAALFELNECRRLLDVALDERAVEAAD
jgi:DNA-binding transcriptional MerR regulator